MIKERMPKKVLYLSVAGFFLKFATTFSIILSCTSFLKTAGAGALPVYYIILNILSISVGTTLAVKNIRDFKFPIYLSSVIGLYLIWFSTLEAATSWGVMALFSITSIYDIYANILFWTHINQCLTIKEIKNYVGVISGVSFFGGILVGLLTKFLLGYISMKSAYVFCGVVHLLLPLVTLLHVESPSEGMAFFRAEFTLTMKRQIADSRLLRIIMLIFILSSFVRYTLGFQYGMAISDQFKDEKSLAGFIGLFDSAVKISVFISQLLAANSLLKNFSLKANLLFYQSGIVVFSLLLFFQKTFWLVVAFQFYFQLFVKLIEQNVASTLFNVFAREIKNQIKFMVEGMVFPLTSIFVGLFITYFRNVLSSDYFFLFLAIAGIIYYISTIKLNEAYMDTIAASLCSGGAPAGIKNHYENPPFENGFDIDFYLSNERGGRLNMVHELERLSPEMGAGLILRLLRDEKDKFVMASLVRVACRHKNEKVQQQLGRTIFSLNDNRVTANFIESAVCEGDSSLISYVTPYIEHSDNRIRANAILAAIKLSSEETILNLALSSLAAMLKAPHYKQRASAAAAIGELGLECFRPALEKLLFDSEISVRKAALAGCEKIASQKLIPVLERMKCEAGNEKISSSIDRAISRIKSGVFSRLSGIINAFPTSDKRKISLLIKKAGGVGIAETLMMILNISPTNYALKFVELFSNYPFDPEFLKLADEFIRNKKFPGESLLNSMVFEEEIKEWKNGLLEILLNSNKSCLEESLVITLGDARIRGLENMRAVGVCFEILGLCINEPAKSRAILENTKSKDGARADMALELLESIENEPLRNAFIDICRKLKNFA